MVGVEKAPSLEAISKAEGHSFDNLILLEDGSCRCIMQMRIEAIVSSLHGVTSHEENNISWFRPHHKGSHVTSISGTCEHTEIELIVRDHDSVQFAVREEYLRKVTEGLNRKYGKETVTLEIHEQYRSMKEVVEKVPCLVDHLVQAIRDCVLCRVGFRSVRAVSGSFCRIDPHCDYGLRTG